MLMHLLPLYAEAEREGIKVVDYRFKSKRIKGLYSDNVITINAAAVCSKEERICVLAEELGHHHTSFGNILDQADVRNRKQERRARGWAYQRLVPLSTIAQAHHKGVRSRHELAAFLGVTEDFLQQAISYYIDKYGLSAQVGHRTVVFEPLGVLDLFDYTCFVC
ncbi:ImmA/IrrE family metallo-endopeptidase [Paenibacillus lycopersici]|uniref:ImmA/IrrE family metallo-endopeptidase n=1 Tax=Paenibacillus lycopersici TaxID=2704462 RepID=A0A6C0G6T3_9BACL|nr:ImmA/IrrE family metallo-endopeptidase [Paenibacillus lycopersici]QHT61735.1 ImmA/IrrE family metallo-endopeptidase [Paenibacillus lycopersici]